MIKGTIQNIKYIWTDEELYFKKHGYKNGTEVYIYTKDFYQDKLYIWCILPDGNITNFMYEQVKIDVSTIKK